MYKDFIGCIVYVDYTITNGSAFAKGKLESIENNKLTISNSIKLWIIDESAITGLRFVEGPNGQSAEDFLANRAKEMVD